MAATQIAQNRRRNLGYYDRYFVGKGIDMGCGDDPVTPDCIRQDIEFGLDAQRPDYPDETFDFVFSSHCLEHLPNPREAVQNWWRILKPGGHLIVAVPDWALYEQKVFPSRFNSDHKWSFSILRPQSFQHSTHLVLGDLFQDLKACQVRSYGVFDERFNYDESQTYDRTWYDKAEAEIEIVCRKLTSDKWSAG